MEIRALEDKERDWVREFIVEHWGDHTVVVHGTVYEPESLAGFTAVEDQTYVGLITYRVHGGDCEIITLDSTRPAQGIGSALVKAVVTVARRQDCQRVWLITTNDNVDALRFYQKRGFRLVSVHRDAVTRSRKLKPGIPLLGNDGIKIQDELELELDLGNGTA